MMENAYQSTSGVASPTQPNTTSAVSDTVSSPSKRRSIPTLTAIDDSSNVSSVYSDLSSGIENLPGIRIPTTKIFSSAGGIVLEVFLFIFTLFYCGSLLAAGLMRANYVSLLYLVCFLITIAFPSYYPYYPLTPLNRILFITPRIPMYLFTTTFAVLFLITQLSFQIVFAAKRSFDPPHWLSDIGFVSYRRKSFKFVFVNLLPELLLIVSGILLYIFIPILWRKRVKWIKLYYNLDNEDPSRNKNQTSEQPTPTNSGDNIAQENVQDPVSPVPPKPLEIIIAPDQIPTREPTIFILKNMLFIFLVALAASFSPSFTSAPYLLLYFALASFYSIHFQLPQILHVVFYFAALLYTAALIILFNLSRYDCILQEVYQNKYGRMSGFIDTTSVDSSLWPAYAFYSVLLVLFVTSASTLNQFISKQLIYKHYMNQLTEDQRRQFHTISVMKSYSSKETFRQFLLDLMSKFVILMLLISLIIVVLTVPSLIAMPYLLLLFLGLLLPNRILSYFLPIAYIYSILNVSSQFAFNIPTVADNFLYPTRGILAKIGFRTESLPSAVIFGQLALTILIGLAMRVGFTVRPTSTNAIEENKEQSESTNYDTDEYTSYDSDATENLEDDDDPDLEEFNSKKKKRRPKTLRGWTRFLLKRAQVGWEKLRLLSIKIVTSYSYYISLIVVYFADLTTDNADSIHAIYLLFFLMFFVFRGLAKRFWILLVFYAQFCIVVLYFFNVYYPDVVGVPYRIMGLVSFKRDSFWIGMIWHFLILFFTSIQYHVQNVTEFAGMKIHREKLELPKVLDVAVRGVQELSKIFGVYFAYLAILLLLLISKRSTMIGIIFFALLFICFILQTYRITRILLYPFWYILVAYSVLVFFTVYVYQFPDVREKLDMAIDQIPEVSRMFIAADSIGFSKFRYKSVSLLPYTIILLLVIFQLKNFQRVKFFPSTSRESPDEPKSLMSELELGSVGTIFSQRIDSFLVDLSRFFKRLSIIHQPKLLLIFLFIAAQLNETIIGLIYFFVVILLAPVPHIASRLWLFIYVYSSSIFLLQYVYQFPYFKMGLRCDIPPPPPGEPNPHTEQPHAACAWFKFGGLKLASPSNFVGSVLWIHVIVLLMALHQKKCFQWQHDLIKKRLFVPGRLFNDEGNEAEREELVKTIKSSKRMHWLPIGVKVFISRIIIDVWSKTKYVCNHLFEDFGYEVCMLILLIGSLLMIQSVWGLLYLVLFGVCFFAGEKRMNRVWVVLILFMELNMIVLYIFKLEKFPLFDLYAILIKWKGSIIFKWIVLRPQDFAGGAYAEDFIVVILYCILFFMALQTRAYVNIAAADKLQRSRKRKAQAHDITSKPASAVLFEAQAEQKHLHASCPVPTDNYRDFTQSAKYRNVVDWIKLMVVFRGFPVIVLLVVFIDASINPSFIKLVQMTICLHYLNFLEQLRWKSKKSWRWLGIFYYFTLILQAVYQIPVVMIGEPRTWKEIQPGVPSNTGKWLSRVFTAIGLRKAAISDLWISILVLVLFYIQDKIFDLNPDYLFFLNFLLRQREKRRKLRVRNKTFRAAQIFRRYVEIIFIQNRRTRNMTAIKEYEKNASSKQVDDNENDAPKTDEIATNDPKILKEIRLRNHYIGVHKLRTDEGSLSQKSEREIFRMAFENIRNSRSLQDDIIDNVDQKRMKELYDSSKKNLERQQRLEKTVQRTKERTKTVRQMLDPDAEIIQEVTVELPPLNPQPVQEEEKQAPVETKEPISPSLSDKLLGVLYYIWITIKVYLIWILDLVIEFTQSYINIAYGADEQLVELLSGETTVSDQKVLLENFDKEGKKYRVSPTEPEKPKRDDNNTDEPTETKKEEPQPAEKPWYDVPDPNGHILMRNKLKEIAVAFKNVYMSNTDIVVYMAMIINSIYSPTIYNMLFTISAFMYAAMQYPFPPRLYWLLILGFSQLMIAVEYILYLIQSTLLGDDTKNQKYSPLELIGWKPRQNLFKYICMYLLVIFAVLQHRDTLKKRGDWYYAEETKKKLLKKQKKQEALDKAIKESKPDDNANAANQEEQEKQEKAKRRHSVAVAVEKVEGIGPVLLEETSLQPQIAFAKRVALVIWSYFSQITNSNAKLGKDYYVPTVAVQLTGFLFFFVSFSYISGRPSTDITGAIQSNELSGTFVMVLFLFFVEICIERVIYLYAKLWPKLIFHFALVIVYHVVFLSMYDYVVKLNNPIGLILLDILFIIKCIYLAISCVQIRNGFPATGIYSSFFAKSYYWIQNYIYIGWRAIPFVFELKSLLDWTFIPTTLTLYEWMKMEDIYSELYNRKCDLEYRVILGRNYGISQYWTRKLFAGFLIFCVVCGIIFFPLLFYSTANPKFSYNAVTLVKTKVAVTGYQSFYENQFFSMTPNLISFQKQFKDYSRANSFSQLDPGAPVQMFNLATWSEIYWIISTPSKENLVKQLTDPSLYLNLTISYEIERTGPATALTLKDQQTIKISTEDRARLALMIGAIGTSNDAENIPDIKLANAYNPYLLNKYSGMTSASKVEDDFYPTCTLGVRRSVPESLYYWLLNCTEVPMSPASPVQYSGPYFVVQSTMIVKDSGLTSAISGIGIIAFYTTFVLTVGQFLRVYVRGLVGRIHFEDVDNVDLLLSFVKDIYIARENKALDLEETMFLQLLRIFRDTTLLQIWTNTNRSIL